VEIYSTVFLTILEISASETFKLIIPVNHYICLPSLSPSLFLPLSLSPSFSLSLSTFVCPTEIIAFSDRIKEFNHINTEVVACSVDSKYTHLAWINTPRDKGGLGHLNIPLISDITKQISRDYGVLLEDEGISLRGLFIIDPKGILRQITMNDLSVGRSVDETLRLVQAFQYTDQHGEACPAGWTPGQKTIVPDPEGSQQYFKQCYNDQ
jgi:alkyl hydroperoxide reductase subunit AhpC